MTMTNNLPEIPPPPPAIARDVVKQIAMDIGKEVAAHIETMYPKAVEAAGKNMLLSVRNCVFNEIMAALETTDEQEILDRLERRKKWRRKHKSMCKANRAEAGAD